MAYRKYFFIIYKENISILKYFLEWQKNYCFTFWLLSSKCMKLISKYCLVSYCIDEYSYPIVDSARFTGLRSVFLLYFETHPQQKLSSTIFNNLLLQTIICVRLIFQCDQHNFMDLVQWSFTKN